VFCGRHWQAARPTDPAPPAHVCEEEATDGDGRAQSALLPLCAQMRLPLSQDHRDGPPLRRPESHAHGAIGPAHGAPAAPEAEDGHPGRRFDWRVHPEQVAALQLPVALQSPRKHPALGKTVSLLQLPHFKKKFW